MNEVSKNGRKEKKRENEKGGKNEDKFWQKIIIDHIIIFFFFNDTATTEIYTLSLHDALPISGIGRYSESDKILSELDNVILMANDGFVFWLCFVDRKSTRLNSSHQITPYAVFCLKKKKHYM